MKIYLSDLKKAGGSFKPYHFKTELKTIGIKGTRNAEAQLKADLEAAYVRSRAIVKGSWEAVLESDCSRCLDPVTFNLHAHIYEEFKHLGESGEPEDFIAVPEEDEDQFVFSGEVLELSEYLRQSFIMSEPLKILCHQDCLGLCTVCGTNKNRVQCGCDESVIDPRWAELQKIK